VLHRLYSGGVASRQGRSVFRYVILLGYEQLRWVAARGAGVGAKIVVRSRRNGRR